MVLAPAGVEEVWFFGPDEVLGLAHVAHPRARPETSPKNEVALAGAWRFPGAVNEHAA
jgi:hypothetical protein